MVQNDSAQIRFPPPLVFLGFVLLGLAIGAAIGRPGFGIAAGARIATAILLAIAATTLIVPAIAAFRSAGTRAEPWEPSSVIVGTGVYAISRNPMYMGMAFAHAALALATDSLAALAMLPIAMIAIRTQVIAREEAYLEAKFGDSYRAYKARVRRWL